MNNEALIKLKEYMVENNINQTQLAQKLGWSLPNLSETLSGHRPLGIKRLLHITDKLGITFEIKGIEHYGTPVPPPIGTVPVISFAKGGLDGFFDDMGYPVGEGFRKVKRPYDLTDPNAYGVEIRGSSMAPKFEERDIVLVSPRKEVVNGDYVVVKTTKDEVMVKRIFFRDGLIVLESFNEPPLVYKKTEILFYHKIVWIKPRG